MTKQIKIATDKVTDLENVLKSMEKLDKTIDRMMTHSESHPVKIWFAEKQALQEIKQVITEIKENDDIKNEEMCNLLAS